MLLKNASILLVDDEPDLLEIMAEWFHREGCTVLVAQDGAEALRLMQDNHLDVVVSDIHMPVMDGVAMLQKIKSTSAYMPSVIFITGFYEIGPREAYELGAEAIMSKPIERTDLVSAVARILTPREELLCMPPAGNADAVLLAGFESLASALTRGLIAFGRGGFCIDSTLQFREGPVDLLLDFCHEQRCVKGRGIIRWVSPEESKLGVEITSIDAANLPWILNLTSTNLSQPFIPRATGAESHLAHKAPR